MYPHVQWLDQMFVGAVRSGATIYSNRIVSAWEQMSPSSRPPFAKSRSEWMRFTSGIETKIVQLYFIADGEVNAQQLNDLTREYDPICDIGPHVAAYWSNLLESDSVSEILSNPPGLSFKPKKSDDGSEPSLGTDGKP
jgi:hypothetical protein